MAASQTDSGEFHVFEKESTFVKLCALLCVCVQVEDLCDLVLEEQHHVLRARAQNRVQVRGQLLLLHDVARRRRGQRRDGRPGGENKHPHHLLRSKGKRQNVQQVVFTAQRSEWPKKKKTKPIKIFSVFFYTCSTPTFTPVWSFKKPLEGIYLEEMLRRWNI